MTSATSSGVPARRASRQKKVIPARKTSFILLASLLVPGRCHDATRDRPGSGPPTTRSAVERREAQRFGGEASQALRSPPARASGRDSHPHPCKARWGVRRNAPAPHKGAVAQRPGASRRSIPSLEGDGKRERATCALAETGSGALATTVVIPGPSAARSPESITTERDNGTQTEQRRRACVYGFRARALGAPRNDTELDPSFKRAARR